MKITEKHLIEFFPRDMRFLYYVANRYNYKFQNDLVAERCNAVAMERIIAMHKEGKEFENDAQLYGWVMNSFRFAMLHVFSENTSETRLKIYKESDITYGEGDDEYSVFHTISEDPFEIDDNASLKAELLKNMLNEKELEVFKMRYERGMRYVDITNETGLYNGSLDFIKKKIRKKYKLIEERLDEDGYEKRKEERKKANKRTIERANRQAYIELRRKTRRERIEEEKRQRNRGSEALSWINLDS